MPKETFFLIKIVLNSIVIILIIIKTSYCLLLKRLYPPPLFQIFLLNLYSNEKFEVY